MIFWMLLLLSGSAFLLVMGFLYLCAFEND
jgi:hypothetical protein